MILTCPACASRYFVEPERLPPQGRKVRCAACGESWRAEPDADPLDLTPDLAPNLATHSAAPLDGPLPAEALPKAFRQQVQAKQKTRQAVAAGVVWAGMATSVLVLIALALVFRTQMVRLWPRTAGVYAAVGLAVNPLGLAPDNVAAVQDLLNGQAALVVTGAERNVDTRPLSPAPVRISLYDRSGARVASRLVRPPDDPIAPGESRPFATSFVDPPMSGVQVGVDFIVETRRTVASRGGRLSTLQPSSSRQAALRQSNLRQAMLAPRLRGLADPSLPSAIKPRSATALPADSPYALPAAAHLQSE